MTIIKINKRYIPLEIVGGHNPIQESRVGSAINNDIRISTTQYDFVKILDQKDVIKMCNEFTEKFVITGFSLGKRVVYKTGSFFKTHVDLKSSDDHIMTMVYVLNDDFTGGELIVDGIVQTSVRSNVVLFELNSKHSVREITSGERISYVFKVYGNRTNIAPIYDVMIANFDIVDYKIDENSKSENISIECKEPFVYYPYHRYVKSIHTYEDVVDDEFHSHIFGIDKSVVETAISEGKTVFMVDIEDVKNIKNGVNIYRIKNGKPSEISTGRPVWGTFEKEFESTDSGDEVEVVYTSHVYVFVIV